MRANKAVLGIDIGTHSLKVVSMSGSGRPKVVAYAEVEVPANVIRPRGIQEKDKIVVSLKAAINNLLPKRVPVKFACTSLPESSVFTKVITLPKMNKSELTAAIQGEINQILPKPAEEMEIDYQLLGGTNTQSDVLVIAADRILVTDMIEIIEKVGLDIIRLETKPAALGRLVIGHNSNPIILIDIGASVSSISIYDWGQIRITATVPVGGDRWQSAIMPHEKYEVKPTQSAADEFIPTIQTIIQETENAIQYYQNRSLSARPINKVLLAGGGSQLKGIEKVFQEKLEIETTLAAPSISLLNKMDNRYYTACGAALDPPI